MQSHAAAHTRTSEKPCQLPVLRPDSQCQDIHQCSRVHSCGPDKASVVLHSGRHTGLIVNDARLSDVHTHASKSGGSVMLSARHGCQIFSASRRTVVLMQTQASYIMLIISMQARHGQIQQHKTGTQKAGAVGKGLRAKGLRANGLRAKGLRAPGMSSGGRSCVERRDHSRGPPCLTSESCWQNPSPRQHLGHHPAAIRPAILTQHSISCLI